ncbi:MAG: hypothetical protein ACRCZJ_01225 [Erysipelotrichaceae bacterium]
MNQRIKVAPSKGNSFFGFFMGLIFIGIGLFVVVPALGVFGIFWLLVAIGITTFHGINAFGKKPIATEEIYVEGVPNTQAQANTRESRLQELSSLYEKRLISKEEFETKKANILAEL